MTVEFLVTSLVVVATPGTGVVYTLAAGLSRGARASVVAAVGCTLGIVPHMIAAITGLAALLHTSALAFLPQFVSRGEPAALLRMLALSGVFMLLTFVVFAGYGLCAAAVRDRVVARPGVMTWLRRVFAGSFLALGARLAVTSR